MGTHPIFESDFDCLTERDDDFVMNLTLLLSLSFAQCVAIYIYLSGFLLKRTSLPNQTSLNNSTLPPSYQKIVILLVDAFRYDFAVYNESNTQPLAYQNKMPKLDSRIKNDPAHAKLFKIYADPPTTTMQRIKAITTGSLPTFVEFSENFSSAKLDEDNFVRQLQQNGKNVVFIGDDTWDGLFPNEFHRSYFYPSLDVADLDTVDFGVYEKLPIEVKNKSDWSLVIGHMLGVDHCGHTFGSLTPHIGNKLLEIDSFIDEVINIVDEDTLVMAFGDHGMTISGDHGGESEHETDAALYVYAPKGFSPPLETSRINQIDLTSSISLLLGAPISFSNLGTPITELFQVGEYQILSVAYRQIVKYLQTYSAEAKSFSMEDFSPSASDLESAQTIRSFLESVREKCRHLWAEFDLFTMSVGACLAVLVSLLISLNNLRIPESILALFLAGMCTSNSFIIMEDQIIQYFTQIMTAAYTFLSIATHAITPTQIGVYLIQSILMRLSFDLRRCRPEQWWCYDLSSKTITHQNINFSILFMVITIGLFYYRNYHFVKGSSTIEVLTRACLLPVIFAVWLGWTLNLLPKDVQNKNSETFENLALMSSRFSSILTIFIIICSYFLLPFTMRKIGAQYSARQEGITMRIEAPKIEVSNLEGAIQGSKVIQIIWFNLLWCILLGPQLSPVSSVLLLDIIFIDWVKSKNKSSMNPEFLRRLEVTRTFFLSGYLFYASGKSTTIAGLPFQAATVGAFPFSTGIPQFFTLISCFGSQVLLLHQLSRDEKNEIDNFGIVTSFYSIRQLGCILSTFMHRRHLMVWNVFAPRLLFEIAEFLVFLIFCFLILSTNKMKTRRLERIRQSILGRKKAI